jgi:hypothetical protein
LLDDWVSQARRKVEEAARVPIAQGCSAFTLEAPTSHDAGMALLDSIRRVLGHRRTPDYLNWFGLRLPEDVADYLHFTASYVM